MSDQKGFNNIVPEQEERIGQRRPASTGKPARDKPASTGSGGGTGAFWKVLVVFLLLAIGGMGWFGWQQYQQLSTLQSSFDDLNSRLLSTDESLSQSGTALQLKIKEQQEELGKHWSEIKKLWGISYDTNKKQIANNKSTMSSHTTRIGKLEKTTATIREISKQVEMDGKKIANISSNSLAVSVEMEDIQQRLQDAADKLNTVEQTLNRWQSDFNTRLSKNEEAVEAIDTYRRQINQELLQLRKQLSSVTVQSSSAPAASSPVPTTIQ